MSDSLRPHESQQPGLPVCHQLPEFTQAHMHQVDDAIQPSHPLLSPFSSCPQSLPASGSFQMSQLFASGDQSIGVFSISPLNFSKSQFELFTSQGLDSHMWLVATVLGGACRSRSLADYTVSSWPVAGSCFKYRLRFISLFYLPFLIKQ